MFELPVATHSFYSFKVARKCKSTHAKVLDPWFLSFHGSVVMKCRTWMGSSCFTRRGTLPLLVCSKLGIVFWAKKKEKIKKINQSIKMGENSIGLKASWYWYTSFIRLILLLSTLFCNFLNFYFHLLLICKIFNTLIAYSVGRLND